MSTWALEPGQAAWIGLTVLALEFFALGFAMREDPAFRHLGLALLLLCLMVGCDIWVTIPGVEEGWGEKPLLDAFQSAFQALACAFVALLIRLVRRLSGAPGLRAARIHTALLAAFALIAAADVAAPADLFIGLRDGEWITSPLYDWAFTPYLIGAMVWIVGIAVLRRRRIGEAGARMLDRLAMGFAFLLVCGSLDFAGVHFPGLLPSASYTLIGMLGFCLVCVFLLTDRLVSLYTERRRYLLEAARVHGELGADEPLREIGRSAALVSDAIRENVTRLRGKVESLREAHPGGHVAELERIERARRRLERMATGILDFSRSSHAGERAPEDPTGLVRAAVAALDPARAARVRVSGPASPAPVPLERARVERALRELIHNAFEAGAERLDIRVLQGLGRTVVVLEDDGEGFEGPLPDILKPFFTTRKAEGAIGLGSSIASGLLRGQGGSLRYYRRPGGGLVVTLVLPSDPGTGPSADPPSCALASGDAARVEDFLAACENLGVRPSLVSGGLEARAPAGAVLIDGAREALTEETLLRLFAGD